MAQYYYKSVILLIDEYDVPVAKARKHATRKMIAGKSTINPPAALATTPATYSFAPRLSVIALRVHAKVRI